MFTVLEIHTGKLGIFLLALLFRAALLLDFWNFSFWHYYLGRHFYSRQESMLYHHSMDLGKQKAQIRLFPLSVAQRMNARTSSAILYFGLQDAEQNNCRAPIFWISLSAFEQMGMADSST